MNVLILGGTQFVGRHVVEALLAGGHRVSVFNRGRSPDDLPAAVERLRGDRDDGAAGLGELRGRSWDGCVDVSGLTPRQVRPSAELLRTAVHRYVFVSAVRVYGEPVVRPVRESHAVVPPASDDVVEVTDKTYGPLKVACEQLVQEIYGERGTLLRPQVVAGAHDPVDRLSYWVRRSTLGGEMLAPGDGSDHLQFIDALDFAGFTRTVVETDRGGTFNLAGPRFTWSEFMTLLGARNVAWVGAELLASAGRSMNEVPLYRPQRGPGSARSGLMDICNARACAAGLTLSDVATTIERTRRSLPARTLLPALSAEREAELIARARRGRAADVGR
jgi:2'-hydroxyisoflavone reductase